MDMNEILQYAVSICAVIIAIVAHEVAHGWAAYKLGDDTAKSLGRLSLNPIRHLDFFGSILLPVMLVAANSPVLLGWAKPVPVSFYRLRHYYRDTVIVSSAGIIVNLCLAFLTGLVLSVSPVLPDLLHSFLLSFMMVNIVLAFFNLIPIPPLDGSKIFFGWIKQSWAQKYIFADRIGMFALLILLFVIPYLADKLGVYFNPLLSYLKLSVLMTLKFISQIF